ncbi:sigma-70 family RNA polymerase sigma factor [Phaeovulum sp.]|uniref:sigma-70 family RNA polymerase sigma factor n=1 Tax=Phaeovulum sp. TaxID=2934796 RepID=UPI0027321591|nr:sigma-70 family RNA polymerase sigma factor [Phaeovulum sp.]MDP1667613.1 sigma-70 family RNA polymerase sigma factor [Phaeovulum sp.]MDZ4118496.1 sigma-70 family RNA polymerase sigma factor [Phaeovulum sp.]
MLTQTRSAEFSAGIITAMPSLRRFALSLCRTADGADDLVQETLAKAWAEQARFLPGSNLHAWLFTILRNSFLNQRRKLKREVQDVDGVFSARLHSAPAHDGALDLRDFRTALAKLPKVQRQALMLVGALGHSYDDAATLSGSESGTIKSRVSRARRQLLDLLQVAGPMDFAPSPSATAPRFAYI